MWILYSICSLVPPFLLSIDGAFMAVLMTQSLLRGHILLSYLCTDVFPCVLVVVLGVILRTFHIVLPTYGGGGCVERSRLLPRRRDWRGDARGG